MTAKTPNAITHYVEQEGDSILPLCGDWNYATSWTTFPGAASCPHCVARLAEQTPRRIEAGGAAGSEPRGEGTRATLRLVPNE